MGIEAFDMQVITWIHDHRNAFLDWFFATVTWAGSLFVLLPLSMLLGGSLVIPGEKRPSACLGWASEVR